MAVLIETSLGDLVVHLYVKERPRCCENFLKLCKAKYYNFCMFHSVQKNLVAQTGDPSSTGRGGDSIFAQLYGEQARFFSAELKPRIKHRRSGLLSMVNNGNNCHGSQFFVTLADNLDYLDGVHTVFGEVIRGEEVIRGLNEAYCDPDHRPYQDIRLYHTIVLEDPFPDPPDLVFPERSPEPSEEVLNSERIGAEEDLDDKTGLSKEELDEMEREKEAKANAQILTMIGDLPEVDARPPDNVLFVCKLNPVTTSEDLEVIFSRFGEIVSCEVIKDKKTDNSLQYAFVEFAREEDCENAFFKMENVLIDDRRIHVDFSQSVAKEWSNYRRGVVGKPKDLSAASASRREDQIVLKRVGRQDQGQYGYVFHESTPGESSKGVNRRKRSPERDSKRHDNKKKKKKKQKERSGSSSAERVKAPSRKSKR